AYSELVHKLTKYVRDQSKVPKSQRDGPWKAATRAQACDLARACLPIATRSTVGVFASGQALESLIMHLLSEDMPEARLTGQKLLDEARKVLPVFLERADKPDRGGATTAYMANTRSAVRQIAESKLPQHLSPEFEDIRLIDYWPKNELDLVPHMLYEHSSLPLKDIQEEVANWSYEDKLAAFKAYFGERLNRRHKPGRALEQAHYSWDLVCDYGVYKDLMRHRMVDDMRWQDLSPRYGYEVPQEVEDAGVSDLFEKCFDISYQLYSLLQSAGYQREAQYATLHGHRMRWKVMYNARQAFHFHELRTTPQGHPAYRRHVKNMHDELAKVHPLIAEAMIFVNQDEDPELTRLAAERYTEYKLKMLDKKT
ncbi:MAG: FAD-dependent thymidylate synthase, partial [Candidatus Saccharimonadales bacterium]|nr:FAD-dependent thymidylate synthase [Candidatus Saccharimonadales bacterium]